MVSYLTRAAPLGYGIGHACFTTDGALRWWLRRAWVNPGDVGHTTEMVWIMLNPSVASEAADDPTIRRCRGYARREGCNTLTVVNLFPVISTQPVTLIAEAPVAPWWEDANDGVILDKASRAKIVVCGWGTWGGHPDLEWRANSVRYLLARERIGWHALGWTANGQPVHPLRQPGDAKLLEA
jgi:hypothetical protein